MIRRAAVTLFLMVAGSAFLGCGGRSGPGVVVTERVRPPFVVAERRALLGQPVARFGCPSPNSPLRDVTTEGFYLDRDSSVVSAEAFARYREAVRPLTLFETQVAGLSDAFVRSRPVEGAAAHCALEWLQSWASQDALLGRTSRQGVYDRTWALATISASYLKVMEAQRSERVEAWIRRLAGETVAYHSSRSANDSKNNHAYWAGAAVGLAAAAVSEKPWFTWAIGQYRLGIGQIAENGTLPLELARRSKARHYHNFALIPLVQIAELGFQNGIDLYNDQGGALRRLANRVIEGLDDDAVFERLAGVRQDWAGEFNGSVLVWMEPYFARTGDQRLAPWLSRFRPLRNPRFGGDVTLLYGVKDL